MYHYSYDIMSRGNGSSHHIQCDECGEASKMLGIYFAQLSKHIDPS